MVDGRGEVDSDVGGGSDGLATAARGKESVVYHGGSEEVLEAGPAVFVPAWGAAELAEEWFTAGGTVAFGDFGGS